MPEKTFARKDAGDVIGPFDTSLRSVGKRLQRRNRRPVCHGKNFSGASSSFFFMVDTIKKKKKKKKTRVEKFISIHHGTFYT